MNQCILMTNPGVDFYMYTPDPKDPMNIDSYLTTPVEELQDSLTQSSVHKFSI